MSDFPYKNTNFQLIISKPSSKIRVRSLTYRKQPLRSTYTCIYLPRLVDHQFWRYARLKKMSENDHFSNYYDTSLRPDTLISLWMQYINMIYSAKLELERLDQNWRSYLRKYIEILVLFDISIIIGHRLFSISILFQPKQRRLVLHDHVISKIIYLGIS